MTASPTISPLPISRSPGKRACIVVAGNPNSGKTSLFNALTGLHHKVANYPGVTVERREGEIVLPRGGQAILIDLPGVYSLSANSPEEIIAAEVLGGRSKEISPDVILVVLDAANLERNLFVLSQILDQGIRVVVALNMVDLASNQGISIRPEILCRLLRTPVVPLVATKRVGLLNLLVELEKALDSPQPSIAPTLSPKFLWVEDAKRAEFLQSHDWRQELEKAAQNSELSSDGLDAQLRYQWAHRVAVGATARVESSPSPLSLGIDYFVSHQIWGIGIFLIVMALLFQGVFVGAQYPTELLEAGLGYVAHVVGTILPESLFRSLIIDGVIAGVGSVLVFVPQIALLFLFIGILEETGYLTRAALVVDRVMRCVGLQGRSFVPLLSSFACAIPGIMATRAITSPTDRLATIFVAPFMSCSARLPVYALLIGAFIPEKTIAGFLSLRGIVLFSLYVLGVVGAGATAFLLKRTVLRGARSLFLLELPRLRWPSLHNVGIEIFERVVVFVKNAGGIILAFSVILWFLASFPQLPPGTPADIQIRESYAGSLGLLIEPLMRPLGFGWEICIGIIASFAARELFVSTLATVYRLGDTSPDDGTLISILQSQSSLTLSSALGLLVFYVFACQCMSTLAVCRRETGTWRWPIFMFTYMTLLAYAAAWVTVTLATYFGI